MTKASLRATTLLAALVPLLASLAPAASAAPQAGTLVAEPTVDLTRQQAAQYLQAHELDKAIVAAQIAIGLFPLDRDAKAILATALLRHGRYRAGLEAAAAVAPGERESYRLAPVIEAAELAVSAEAALAKATGDQTLAEWRNAADFLENATQVDPDNLAIRKSLGWLYYERLNEPDKASRLFSTVRAANPSDLDAAKLLALATQRRGRVVQAIQQYREVLAIDPADRWIQINLAKALTWTFKYDEAERLYRVLLLTDPNDLDCRLGLIEIQARRGELSQAIASAVSLSEAQPQSAAIHSVLGELYRWDWRFKSADGQYDKALSLDSSFAAAQQGRAELREARAIRVDPRAFQFVDSDHFARAMSGFSTRVPVNDRTYIVGAVERWGFNVFTLAADRTDLKGGVEYHWNRRLETQMSVGHHGGEARDGSSLSLTTKWALAPLTLYVSHARGLPVDDSIVTVRDGLAQVTSSVGLDLPVTGALSVQVSVDRSRYDDGNVRREWRPQLSLRVHEAPEVTVRLEYNELRFSRPEANYFAPPHFRSLKPVVEAQPRLTPRLSLLLKGELPFVVESRRAGANLAAGVVLKDIGRVRGEFTWFRARVPSLAHTPYGVPTAWSGSGVRASASVGFR